MQTYELFARLDAALVIRAADAAYLYEPEQVLLRVSGELLFVFATEFQVLGFPTDSCEKNTATISAARGYLIVGRIQPELAGIDVVVETRRDGTLRATTDERGLYRVGPIHDEQIVSASATKEGFVIERVGDSNDFRADKLTEVTIRAVDDGDAPLADVLVSLSNAAGYRKTAVTDERGEAVFRGLAAQADYLLRAMKKEYEFDPASQSLSLEAEETVAIVARGHRVAFSLFGRVTMLSKTPISGVLLEALAVKPCPPLQGTGIVSRTGAS